jgi:hypothetical protein
LADEEPLWKFLLTDTVGPAMADDVLRAEIILAPLPEVKAALTNVRDASRRIDEESVIPMAAIVMTEAILRTEPLVCFLSRRWL